MSKLTNIKIDNNKLYISRNTSVYHSGYMVDLNELSAGDCLVLMDKLKRVYFDKLKGEVKNE